MQEDVGYPPYIKKDSELDTHYSMVSEAVAFREKRRGVAV